jgi:hypothetical protein
LVSFPIGVVQFLNKIRKNIVLFLLLSAPQVPTADDSGCRVAPVVLGLCRVDRSGDDLLCVAASSLFFFDTDFPGLLAC